MEKKTDELSIRDLDTELKWFTQARIALGSTGESIPLEESFKLKMAHAYARTAIYSSVNADLLFNGLEKFGLQHWHLHSSATERYIYLQRPDLGRKLSARSEVELKSFDAAVSDVVVILADGLSANAVNDHALPLLDQLIPMFRTAGLKLAHLVLAEQARVAIGDEIGYLLNAGLTLMLIGERPGLSSPNSLGAYITCQPRPGLTDEMRNCVSNIRPEGLAYGTGSQKIFYLVTESLKRKVSGIELKDESGLLQ